jgi:hypothetical protein
MTKQELFIESITKDKIESLKLFLKDPDINPADNHSSSLRSALDFRNFNIVEILVNDGRVDFMFFLNYMSVYSDIEEYRNIFEKIIIKENLEFEDDNNFLIIDANNNNYTKAVDLIWKNKAVKNTLQKDDVTLYNSLVKKDIQSKIKIF